jgi:DNA-binding PadR family transcriptional regulator
VAKLTPTSYAILGLLAIRPWSTYELTKLFGRSVQYVMPRSEANRYLEAKRLVDAGLATAEETMVGQRRRTEYRITAAGRRTLDTWLAQPARPTELESEGLLKVLFADRAPTETLLARIAEIGAEAEAVEAPWRDLAREYASGDGMFPERIHVNALYWILLDRWAQLRADWARWATMEVESWDASGGRPTAGAMERLLGDMLEGRWGAGFPDRPASATEEGPAR